MRSILIMVMGIMLLQCMSISLYSATMDPPHDSQGCLTCHDMLAYDQSNLIPDTGPPIDIDDCKNNRICIGCHNGVDETEARCHSSLTTSDKYGNWRVGCSVCHNQHLQEQNLVFGSTYGKFVRRTVNLLRILDNAPPLGVTIAGKDGFKAVKFVAETGANSFVDGDATFDGICQVCHTKTNHFRNTGEVNVTSNGYDHTGTVGTDCMECHDHSNGFGHGGGSGTGCIDCHGHDAGTNFDIDMTTPYTAGGVASQGNGTFQSHSTHTETDIDDLKGPGIYCNTCHDINNFPFFNSGTDADGDGKYNLAETDVCNGCHSQGGSYDGIGDPVIGAKTIWGTGAYVATDDSTLQADKQKWCAGCHDESASVISSVTAPNIIGDEDGSYIYGTGWGYYKTGHGLPGDEPYPYKGGFLELPLEPGVSRAVNCDSCHDFSTAHVDGFARTFDDGDSSDTDPGVYRQGYRLKLVNGEEPMQIPWKKGTVPNEPDAYRLCAECHITRPFITSSTSETNMITDGVNRHYAHLQMNGSWTSPDFSGVNTSRPTCVACHNVHGSTQLAMVRDGKLIGREPGLQMWYYNGDTTVVNETNADPPDPEDTPLSASDGTVWRGQTSSNLCSHCHHNNNTTKENRIPYQDVSVAPTLDWTGENGYVSDGANPDSAVSGSNFTFRVKYTDLNNDGPVAPGYINLLIDNDNDGSADATYPIEGADSGDLIYLDGKIYSKSLILSNTGSRTIGYTFKAQDETGLDAIGSPTNWSTVSLLNNAPILSWTGEEYYESDGVNPDRGISGSDFMFRVLYRDADGECPDADGVDVDVNGTIYDLTLNDGASCATGRIYYEPITLTTTGDLTYHFITKDSAGAQATGESTSNHVVMVLGTSNNPPFLEWVDGTCRTEGVKPAYGAKGADFEFYVKYTDPDGDCPSAVDAVQVTINGSSHNMIAVDADSDCSDGKLYSYTTALTTAGSFNYSFSATDDGGTNAFGDPSSVHVVTVVDALKVRPEGGGGWYDTIQGAVNVSSEPSTILVYPNSDFTAATYNEKVVTFIAGVGRNNRTFRSVCGADLTVVDGTDSAFYIQDTANTEIDGFAITGSSADGIELLRGDNTTIVNCKIHTNPTGLTSNNSPGLVIDKTEIYSNAIRGINSTSGTNLIITDSLIHSNGGSENNGAGVNINSGIHTITNSTIRNNTSTLTADGGGLFIQSATVTVSKSSIRDNTAGEYGGAFGLNTSTLNLENSIIADNRAAKAGAIYQASGTISAINSTFADNRATSGNGGVLYTCNVTSNTFKNSVFWNNTATGAGHNAFKDCGGGSFMDISYSDISTAPGYIDNGVFTGSNSMTPAEDPFFVDAEADNYHIQSHSPLIDQALAGDAPADDIDGDSRPQGAADDIGADEYSVSHTALVLSWTGEPGYVSDGINPDSGDGGNTNFVFRVDYTDANDNPPVLIQVWIDEDDNGVYGADEKFTMTEVDSGDTDYTDSKRYALSRVLNYTGDGSLKFRFYAMDGSLEAGGEPTVEQSLTLTNNIPVLSWTGETDYVSDGVDPFSGKGGSLFTFRVKYSDGDNVAPDPVQVWIDIDNSGSYDVHEKFGMTWVDDGDKDYTDGEKYTRTLQIPYTGNGLDPLEITYRFYATDGGADATGDPVADNQKIIIDIEPSENSTPTLSWSVAECLDNGVRPPVGDIEVPFEFKVLYTDVDGTGPEAGGIYKSECAVDILLLVDKDNSGTYDSDEKYVLTEADTGDGDCTDGKLYETILNLEEAVEGELKYSFYATDSFAAATGKPTVDSTFTVYSNSLKVRPSGGAGWLTTIQSAEDSSFNGATILVYPNDDFTAATYSENIEARTTNLEIRSACGPDLTILDGGGSAVGVLLRADNQILDGFSVTNTTDGLYINPSPENITIKNNKIYGNSRYGINVNPGFNIHIDNNEIYNNDSSGIRTNGSTVEITDCDVHHNYAAWGGGIMFNGNIHTITDSVIRDNSGVDGAGIVFNVVGEGTTVTNTVISNNNGIGRGGGIYNTGGSQLVLDKCMIIGNQTTSAGGAIYSQSGWDTSALVRMSNSFAAGNSAAGKGGFVFHHSGLGEYYNNTFADNHSSSYGGVFGVCVIPEQLEVRNSVFWGNTAVDGTIGSRYMCNGNGPLIHVTDSYFSTDSALSNFSWGTVSSENNIDCCEDKYPADPDKPAGFIEFNVGSPGFSDDGSYHIKPDSLLIDRANTAYAPEDDIDENGRTVGLGGDGSPDMGADEYKAPADSTTAGYVTAYASNPANNTSIAVTMPYLGDADGDNTCTVDYKLSSAKTSVWSNWVTDADCSASPYTTTITGLAADEEYDVRTTFADPDGVDGKFQRTVSSVDLNWYVDLTVPTRSTAEDAGTVTVTATLSRVSDQTVTVPFTVSGTATAEDDDPINYDHDLSDGSIQISAGNLTGEMSFAVNDDDLDEANEIVFVTMGTPENALAGRYDVQAITITDDDSSVLVDFTSASETTVAESGTVTIMAQLSEVSGMDVEVPFTVNVDSTALGEGVDYSITESPVIIAAGDTTAEITITVKEDSSYENDETVIVDMGSPINAAQGAVTTHTLTITDDD